MNYLTSKNQNKLKKQIKICNHIEQNIILRIQKIINNIKPLNKEL